jgi:hypothetical protein
MYHFKILLVSLATVTDMKDRSSSSSNNMMIDQLFGLDKLMGLMVMDQYFGLMMMERLY